MKKLKVPVYNAIGKNLVSSLDELNHILLVAGPSCVGKSVFLEKLAIGDIADIADMAGITQFVDSRPITANKLSRINGKQQDRLIVHYAMPVMPLLSGKLKNVGLDERLSILSNAREVHVVTLLATARILRERLRTRQRGNRKRFFQGPRMCLSRAFKLHKLDAAYSSSASLQSVYQQWFQYCEGARLTTHSLIIADESYAVWDASDWRSVVAHKL